MILFEFEICTKPSATFGADSEQAVPLDRGSEAKTMGSGAEEWSCSPVLGYTVRLGLFVLEGCPENAARSKAVKAVSQGPYTPYP